MAKVVPQSIDHKKNLRTRAFSLKIYLHVYIFAYRDLSVENLQYLNSEQALADLAGFTQAMKDKYNLTVSYS